MCRVLVSGHDLNNESFTTRLPVTPADSSCRRLETSEVYWTFFLVTGDGVEMLTCRSNLTSVFLKVPLGKSAPLPDEDQQYSVETSLSTPQ